jgi:hypothetical protein
MASLNANYITPSPPEDPMQAGLKGLLTGTAVGAGVSLAFDGVEHLISKKVGVTSAMQNTKGYWALTAGAAVVGGVLWGICDFFRARRNKEVYQAMQRNASAAQSLPTLIPPSPNPPQLDKTV